jgi:general secretion pathway protein L
LSSAWAAISRQVGDALSLFPPRDLGKQVLQRVDAELCIDCQRATLTSQSHPGNPAREFTSVTEALLAAGVASKLLVTFTESSAFVHAMQIPAAAARESERILRMEAERMTPFKLAEMLRFWWTETEAPGAMRAHQVLVKKTVAESIGGMARTMGHSITTFGYRGPDNHLSPMLLSRDGTVFGSSQERLWKSVAAGALALFILVAGWSLFTANNSIAARSSDADVTAKALESKARDIRGQFDAQREVENKVAKLVQLKRTAPSASQSISELARLLPDTAWVQTLSLRGNKIQIDGEAMNAEALIRTLDESLSFADVMFTTPVYSLPPSGKQRFSISMTVEGLKK